MVKKNDSKKMKTRYKVLLGAGIALVLLYIVALVLISPPAKNLGVKWTEEDAQSATVKLGRERGILPSNPQPRSTVSFEGSHDVDAFFTSEELSATINTRDYVHQPAKNVQIRMNEDGTGEVSGTVLLSQVIPFGEAFSIRNDKAKDAVEGFIEDLPINPTFYVKGTPKIVNNQAQFEAEEIKVGVFDLTDTIADRYVNDLVEQQIAGVPGLRVDSLEIVDGKLHFDGAYPDKSMYTPK